MRRFFSVAVISLVLSSAGPHGQGPAPGTHTESTAGDASSTPTLDETAAAWFVELRSPPTIEGTSTEALEAEEVRFHEAAAVAGLAYLETAHYRHVWNGLTVETTAGMDALRSVPGVAAVYPVVAASRAQQETPPDTVADMVTALEAGHANIAQDTFGLSGAGIRVAVVDSGIDYHHPDLGGCFGEKNGCRVAKGWDFVGDAFNPDRNAPGFNPVAVPDADPDDCDGHGTHVAGIIGGNGTIRGVAPKVALHAYRVFGCVGPTTTDVILAAMERAYQDGADIINLSLGAPLQWPQYPTAASASRLVKNGVIVVASGGNVGVSGGLYAADAPGVGDGVISVASFDNTAANLASGVVSPGNVRIGYLPATGSVAIPTLGSFSLARTVTAATQLNDACSPLPAGSLSGTIALIRRGTCGFPIKASNAQAAGAVGALIANNAPGRIPISVESSGPTVDIPVVSISGVDGAQLDARLAVGIPVTFTWTPETISEPQATGNLISSFSSYGPTPTLDIKPDLGAPGGAIRSTLPIERGSFGTLGGTSMAAPYVAGAIALMLEAHPGLTAPHAVRRLQNTARPRLFAGDPGLGVLDLVHRQGAGLITVDQAIATDVEVTPSTLALGELESSSGIVRRLRIRGLADKGRSGQGRDRHRHGDDWHDDDECDSITYTLGHQPALPTGATSVATSANTFAPGVVRPANATDRSVFATVEFSMPTVRLGRYGSGEGEFKLLITPPANVAARLFGGYITLTPDDGGAVLNVPYLGYNGDYQEIAALTPGWAPPQQAAPGFPWLARIVGSNLVKLDGSGDMDFSFIGADSPLVVFHLDHQVGRLRADVIDMSNGKSIGFIDDQSYVARNSTPSSFFVLSWDGRYTPAPGATPVRIGRGEYRIELLALKAGGDKRQSSHVERWVSPTFTVSP